MGHTNIFINSISTLLINQFRPSIAASFLATVVPNASIVPAKLAADCTNRNKQQQDQGENKIDIQSKDGNISAYLCVYERNTLH